MNNKKNDGGDSENNTINLRQGMMYKAVWNLHVPVSPYCYMAVQNNPNQGKVSMQRFAENIQEATRKLHTPSVLAVNDLKKALDALEGNDVSEDIMNHLRRIGIASRPMTHNVNVDNFKAELLADSRGMSRCFLAEAFMNMSDAAYIPCSVVMENEYTFGSGDVEMMVSEMHRRTAGIQRTAEPSPLGIAVMRKLREEKYPGLYANTFNTEGAWDKDDV